MTSRRDRIIGYSVIVIVGICAAELVRYMAFHGASHLVVAVLAVVVVVLMAGATVVVARRSRTSQARVDRRGTPSL